MKNSISTKQKGFTLVEILLVMLITSFLVLGVNVAFRQAHMLWSRAEEQRPVYQKTRLLLDTMRTELACLYMPKLDDDQQPAPFSLSSLSQGDVKLSFFTLNPAWKSSTVSNLPAKVSYEFTTDPDSGQRAVSRAEQLFSGEKMVGTEQEETILEGFSGIAIQAAETNGGSLADSWKSDLQCDQTPPKAVKVLLKWAKDEQTDFEFDAVIKISCQKTLISE